MRILMFTRYTAMGANSRYRLLQYVPWFEAAGHPVAVRAMLGDDYLEVLYSSRRRSVRAILRGYARRISQLQDLSQFDVVICDQEFLPYFPAAVERWIARRCPRLFVDYDDAAYCKYQNLPGLRGRIPGLMAQAEAVVVGNRYLADFASRHNPNVHIIPTVVDTRRYTAKKNHFANAALRLVWIGTPVTAADCLLPIAGALTALREKYPDIVLRLIGAGDAVRAVLPFAEVVPWSEATEAQLLAECDIGLMPLPDNNFTRGKCGLKLIQCMAAGLPVVASPVGANCDIVGQGTDGYLADGPQQWSDVLERLILSADLRRELGGNGAAKVARQYSLETGFDAWMRVLVPQVGRMGSGARKTVAAVGS